MADMATGIIGVVLAWKGIVEFGRLISRLTDDDDRERNVPAIRLESYQQLLQDWGEHWGVDREDGRFHGLERARKELVIKIIFQLRDSRVEAIRRLRKRHGMFNEEDRKLEVHEGRLSRMIESFVASAQRSRKKARWLMGDDILVAKLVDETMQLHSLLD